MDIWTDDERYGDGLTYISTDVLSSSSFDCDTIAEANIRALQDRDDVRIMGTRYNGRQAWLLDTPENRDLIESLERDYPLIDDEKLSEVKSEKEEEAFSDWINRELLRAVEKENPGVRLAFDIELLGSWTLYRRAMDAENVYPVFESSGCYVDVKRIAPAFVRLATEQIFALLRAALEGSGFRVWHELECAPADALAEMMIAADWLADHERDDLADVLREHCDALSAV